MSDQAGAPKGDDDSEVKDQKQPNLPGPSTRDPEEQHIPEELGEQAREFFEQMPEPLRKEMIRFASFSSGPSYPPYMDKIEGDHISAGLDIVREEMQIDYKQSIWNRCSAAFYIILSAALFVFITVYIFDRNSALYVDILKVLLPLGAGFLGGYGYGKSRR